MWVIFALGLVALAFFITYIQGQGHESSINSQIESLGGRVISIERRSFFSGLGPFHVVGKGRVVYRIEYEVNGQLMEGWVRFGGLMGPDWRL